MSRRAKIARNKKRRDKKRSAALEQKTKLAGRYEKIKERRAVGCIGGFEHQVRIGYRKKVL